MIVWVVTYTVQDGGGGVLGIYNNPEAAAEHLKMLEDDPEILTEYEVQDLEIETEFVDYQRVH